MEFLIEPCNWVPQGDCAVCNGRVQPLYGICADRIIVLYGVCPLRDKVVCLSY